MHRTRLMATLFVAQVCGSTGHSMSLAVGSIIAAEITGTNVWSGLPVAIGSVGTALASWPLARLMGRFGRRPGLALGYGLAVIGAAGGMAGVIAGSFAVMLVGMALFGIANTSNLLARYAAADITPVTERGRAMGLIVWGSTAGSIIGPNLMGLAVQAGRHVDLSPAGSAFLISIAGYGLAMILVQIFLRPDPLLIAREMQARVATDRAPAAAREFWTIAREPRVRVALGALTLGQFVMIATTSTSPLYLHDQGHAVGVIGIAVSMHLAGMYVASPLSGWLSDRFGRMPVIIAGGVGLIGAVLLAGFVPGHQGALVIFGLFLNGIGWNLSFVAGSALLTDALAPTERASVQGLADLALGMSGALGSTVGGMILGTLGFTVLNAASAVLVVGSLFALRFARRPVRLTTA
ncbi:MAG: MFS transporter [Candidatus Rokubacteria bacterium]|nr:MFS transporter [Candidatus Rokubacteria bacterium]